MPEGPLSGVVVVDLTRVLAGPFCTMMLAELGARVIKVEPPGGDDSRQFAPFVDGRSGYFASLNRGKESIVLDLKADADRETFLALVRRGDVLVENYRPGTLERLGLGHDRLCEVNPRLIHASVSGFGQTGPWAQRPAYDVVVQALGGLMSVTGYPDGPPTKAGTSVGDLTGGMFLLAGVCSALYHREHTGKAVRVDVSMLDGQIAILEGAVVRCANTGQVPGRIGNRHPAITPFQPYQTADRPLVIAAGNDALFVRTCEALGVPGLTADPRFVSNRSRTEHAADLQAILEGVLRGRPAADWLAVLEGAGVPCAVVQDVAEALAHPQIQARNMVVEAGGLRMAGNPIKVSGFADPPTRPAPPELDGDSERLRREFS